KRPTGVTILAVLYVLHGLFWLSLIPTISYVVSTSGVDFPVEVTGICWGISLILMLFYFGIAYGLLKGSGWARTLAILFAIIGLLNIPIGTIVSIIILIYLFKDDVKAYFR
ncbi:MAG: hypothetical protein ACOC5D_07705, partial [Thermoplasmatota archaeon]